MIKAYRKAVRATRRKLCWPRFRANTQHFQTRRHDEKRSTGCVPILSGYASRRTLRNSSQIFRHSTRISKSWCLPSASVVSRQTAVRSSSANAGDNTYVLTMYYYFTLLLALLAVLAVLLHPVPALLHAHLVVLAAQRELRRGLHRWLLSREVRHLQCGVGADALLRVELE